MSVKLAILYDNGILAGYTEPMEPEEAEEDDNHVIVPEECDLTPGRYRWVGTSFHPLTPRSRAFRDGPSDLEMIHACAQFLIAQRDGKPMPEYTLDKLAKYEETFDAQVLEEDR